MYDKKNWNLDAERDLWKAVCSPFGWFDKEGNAGTTHQESLWWFVHIAWGAEFFQRQTRRRWIIPRVHAPYLKWLQDNIVEWKVQRKSGKGKRMFLSVVLPRNFGKSITATRCASLWSHLDEPNMSTLLGSATLKLSEDFLATIASTIADTSEGNKYQSWFRWLFGNWKNPNREWTKTSIKHAYRQNTNLQEPSYDITAVDTGMTGYHHDQHWWDDPIIANKLKDSGAFLQAAHVAFDASYKALQSDGLLVLVCTRYLDDDVAGRKWVDEGIKSWDGMESPNSMIYQKHEHGKGIWRVYFLQVENELTGKAICPEIMDEERIAQEKLANAEDFACQYQNNPGASEHAPLTERQARDCFYDYALLRDTPISDVSIHLDTAFKTKENIGKGDYSAIVPFLHDVRDNGTLYLDTDNMKASNLWRSEEFSEQLIEVMIKMRKRLYTIKCITDEKEPGGKEGIYKQNLIATLRGAGIRVPKIMQFTRSGTNKRQRIRKAAGLWAEGYVKILLHKSPGCTGEGLCAQAHTCRHWIIPPVVQTLLNQIMRVDVVTHDDLADASADVFMAGVWRRPVFDAAANYIEEGFAQRQPGDEQLKLLSRPISNDELKTLMAAEEEMDRLGYMPGQGEDDNWLPKHFDL